MNISTNYRKLSTFFLVLCLMLLSSQTLFAQETRISGKITSSDDKLPLPGVSINVKGTNKGVSSDANGLYSISANPGDILVFKSIGFQTLERKVGSGTSINVVLSTETNTLNEVVVVGYGVQKKKLTTGANLQVKGDDLQKQNTTNALQALQGQAPGVQVTSTSGQPGSGMNVVIRGKGTIGNSSPLYVVDGVITGDISYLNPADIESMDVLKDAASAAIYGSQAANGVVLVTTRTGRLNQKAVVTFDSYVGTQNVASKTRMLNSKEFATIMNEAAINSGSNPYFNIASLANMAEGTDWLDHMLVNNAGTQNYSLGVQGGTKATSYSTALSYTSQNGVVGGADLSSYSRVSFRVNTEHNLYKDIIKLGQHATYSYTENSGIGVGGLYNNSLRGAFNTSPLLPMYDETGKYFNARNSTWNNGESNPYAELVYNNQNKSNGQRLLGDVYLSVEPIKNLRFRTSLSVNFNDHDRRTYRPVYDLSIYSFNNVNSASDSTSRGRSVMFDNLLSYRFAVKKTHSVEVMAGTSSYSQRGTNFRGGNTDLRFEGFDYAYLGNAEGQSIANMIIASSPWDQDKRLSYFGRANYNYKEKYLLNATLRADGSSRFAKGNRWGYFPSVAAGWVVTGENFLSTTTNWLDYLKLRASWGQVGNQNIDYFQYLQTVQFSNANYTFGNTEGALSRGAYPDRLGNPNVKWETSEQTNVGLDSRFLKGKISLTADYYVKDTKDWLIAAPILATAGANAPFINGGDVRNSGLELGFSFRNTINKLNYSIGLNGSYNKNKVGNIPNLEGIIHGATNTLYNNSPEFYRAQNGLPVGYFWGYKTAGIFQTEEEVNTYRSTTGKVIQPSAAPGDLRYVDINGDGSISDLDKTIIGDPNPNYTFGLNLSADYKGFDFFLQAGGVAGNQIVQSLRNQTDGKANFSEEILGRWHGPGSSNTIPRVTVDNRNFTQFSDLYVQNGDYLRINTVTVGYDFSRILKRSYLKNLRVYASALNLYTFTKYTGMDPEIGYSGTDDNVNSGRAFSSGVDVGYYPRPRTFMLGTNFKF
ncbi:SusC/RagA family TonB-linked outer membrane protein [Desertivirga arenae]|uniref:SusC/RagA family TonB-linked outer membrane protein n=1 Tax=Desertivirga arenae TaxID=2810309 RepID=UPI001A976A70|nr:TonB-dependent receptor [Pedobacter sp. SYSU D00823]